MGEQMIEANGVQLCAEPLGNPAHSPILLIMGTGASMLWWEEGSVSCSRTAVGS
jgi:hypothetical protein